MTAQVLVAWGSVWRLGAWRLGAWEAASAVSSQCVTVGVALRTATARAVAVTRRVAPALGRHMATLRAAERGAVMRMRAEGASGTVSRSAAAAGAATRRTGAALQNRAASAVLEGRAAETSGATQRAVVAGAVREGQSDDENGCE